jgi:hypothetical protein
MGPIQGIGTVAFGFMGGVIGAVVGTIVGLIGLFFGWPFFTIAFCFTVGFGLIGAIWGSFA